MCCYFFYFYSVPLFLFMCSSRLRSSLIQRSICVPFAISFSRTVSLYTCVYLPSNAFKVIYIWESVLKTNYLHIRGRARERVSKRRFLNEKMEPIVNKPQFNSKSLLLLTCWFWICTNAWYCYRLIHFIYILSFSRFACALSGSTPIILEWDFFDVVMICHMKHIDRFVYVLWISFVVPIFKLAIVSLIHLLASGNLLLRVSLLFVCFFIHSAKFDQNVVQQQTIIWLKMRIFMWWMYEIIKDIPK